jgi:hypothetical protein
MIVLPGGGYATHVAHEGEPIVSWLNALGVRASVFRYPLRCQRRPASDSWVAGFADACDP